MTASVDEVLVNSGNGTTITVKIPTVVNAGDLWLAIVTTDRENGVTTHADWTLEDSGDGSFGNDVELFVYSLVADGTESGDYSFTHGSGEQWCAITLRISGHDGIDVINVQSGAGSGATQTAPSVTTTVDDCLVIRAVGSDRSDTYSGTHLWEETDGSGVSTCGDEEVQASAGATGTYAFAFGTGGFTFVPATIAIAPGS